MLTLPPDNALQLPVEANQHISRALVEHDDGTKCLSWATAVPAGVYVPHTPAGRPISGFPWRFVAGSGLCEPLA
jgi:hypothetical protein